MLERTEIEKYLPVITKMCLDRFDTYFQSDCYKGLKARCDLINDAIDGRFKANEAFIAEVAPPVISKNYRENNAFLLKYFENDPIVSFRAIGSTEKENADNMISLIQCNFMNTRFREECLLWVFDNLARYGTGIIFSQFDKRYKGVGLQTVYSPEGDTPYPRQTIMGKEAVCNYSIHPLNYFQDPKGNSMARSYFEGFIDQWYVSDLNRFINDERYFQEPLAKVIKDCKNGQNEKFWFSGMATAGYGVNDYSRATINPRRFWTLLNFENNEFDPTIYYVEIIADRVVRCEPVDYDGGVIPLQKGVWFPRPDVWWGNSSLDYKMPFQNLKNWIINSQVEATMKQMDRIILVRRGGGLNVADINNRHQFGGVVFYEGAEDPSRLMYPVQFGDASLQNVEWLNREINQMDQETSPVVNLQNKYNQGGMNNNTLGAAQMVAGIGEVMYNYSMRNVGYLIERVAEINAALMIQFCGDRIKIKRSDYETETEIEKREILGEFVVKAENSMLINEKQDRMDTSNIINQVLNWSGTGRPEFQGLDLTEFVKDWVRSWVGKHTDVTRYFKPVPPQLPMMQPGAPPSQQGAPAAPQLAGPPMPPAMPVMPGAPNV